MAIYQKLRDLLFDAGLSEAETLVYIELLKKPALTIWDLVLRTGLSKSTVYRSFIKLRNFKMVEKNREGIRALSLRALISELVRSERKLRKTAYLIKQIAPFLRAPRESIEEIETFYTPEQIAETYVSLSSRDFDVSLDYGDFENFVPIIGGLKPVFQFRTNRLKHATNHAICTSFGPYTAIFCTPEAKTKFKQQVDILKNDFCGNFIAFSDRDDYVMFNNFTDPENSSTALVKSKTIADIQRAQLKNFSQRLGN